MLASARLSYPGAAPYNGHLCATYRFHASNHLYDSAHCHAIVSTPQLWMYGAGWALVALLIGFFVFWRAETRYGRG